jgi:putative aldouronate transport system permease protein
MKILTALSLKAKIIAGAVAVAATAGTAAVVIVISMMPEAFRLLKIFEMTGTSVVTRADAGAIDAYTGMNLESGDIIDTLTYRMGFSSGRFDLSTAAGLFKSVISCILVITSYKVAYKTSGYRVF